METRECSICNDSNADNILVKYHNCTKIKTEEEIIIIINEKLEDNNKQEIFSQPSEDENERKLFEPKIELNEVQSETFKAPTRKRCKKSAAVKSFLCSECGKSFSLQSTLNRHILKHTEIKPYVCNVCSSSFRFKHYLASHKMTHMKKPFLCELCGTKFRRKNDLKAHKLVYMDKICKNSIDNRLIKDEDIKPDLDCDSNDGVKNEFHEIKANIKKIDYSDDDFVEENDDKEIPKILEIQTLNDVIFKCSLCPKVFRKRRYIKDHILVHSGDKPFVCQECGTGFSQKGTLNRHMLQHSDLKPYKCDICNSAFKLKHYLTSHYLTHTTDRPYACDSCISTFARKYDLDAHIRQKHLRVQKFQCDKCGQRFTRRKHLNMHLVVHAKSTGPQCQICWKFFKNEERLNLHRRFHLANEVGSHKCYICDAMFTRHTYLSKHLEKHSVVDYVDNETAKPSRSAKTFECATCNGNFATKSQLEAHDRKHLVDMPFPCTVCHKRFRRRSNLVSHSYMHTGVKNHKCGDCPKRFSQKHLLTQHMKAQGHTLSFSCNLCGEAYKASKDLKQHVIATHGIEDVSCIVEINEEGEGLILDPSDEIDYL